MARFVLIPGAWLGGWVWKRVSPLLRAAGHEVFTPTLSGLGERAHQAHAAINLETHIQDVIAMLHYEDLQDVILLGHSYGGMVITGVADRVPERLAQIVYLDAFVPEQNQSLHDLVPAGARSYAFMLARERGDGWRLPLYPEETIGTDEDMRWLSPRWTDQPLQTFDQAIQLTNTHTVSMISHIYIHCTQKQNYDFFAPFAQRFQKQTGWEVLELESGHTPQVTEPLALAHLLLTLAEPIAINLQRAE